MLLRKPRCSSQLWVCRHGILHCECWLVSLSSFLVTNRVVSLWRRWVVDKLHSAGIAVMNMVGSPKHVQPALDAGVDLICAQGTEGGGTVAVLAVCSVLRCPLRSHECYACLLTLTSGHTGDLATSVLIPAVVDACRGKQSAFTRGASLRMLSFHRCCRSIAVVRLLIGPVLVVAAGGIFDGRGLAAALQWGAAGVWVGTRFVCATEAGAPARHQVLNPRVLVCHPLICSASDYRCWLSRHDPYCCVHGCVCECVSVHIIRVLLSLCLLLTQDGLRVC